MFAFIFQRKRRAHKRTRGRFLLPEEWRKIRHAAGCRDVWIHDLRRTLGAWMTMHGESIRIIQTIMNHSDIRVTARCYTPFQIHAQREALNRHAERVMG